MEGDYHDVNSNSLDRVQRMLRGEFEEVPTSFGAVAGSKPVPERSEIVSATAEVAQRQRKKAGENQQLQIAGMEDDTPEELVELAREYKRCQTSESKAKEKTKNKMAEILDKMHELGIQKMRLEVDGNMKWLKIAETEKLKWEKSETVPMSEE